MAKTFGALVLASALVAPTNTWADLSYKQADGITAAKTKPSDTLNFELNQSDREATVQAEETIDPTNISSAKLGIKVSNPSQGDPIQESFGSEILSHSDRSRVENINATGTDDSGPQSGPPSMAILKPILIVLAVMAGIVFFITALTYRSKNGFD
ncbi:MAG: hypothetical protein M3Y82_09205 [Verrucomicrobiota bacterium]|nr:hypothetical protein [Verrucomicrobiota bacterium]